MHSKSGKAIEGWISKILFLFCSNHLAWYCQFLSLSFFMFFEAVAREELAAEASISFFNAFSGSGMLKFVFKIYFDVPLLAPSKS